jgi:formylglycine-generating enzyme required for sulfatase activity
MNIPQSPLLAAVASALLSLPGCLLLDGLGGGGDSADSTPGRDGSGDGAGGVTCQATASCPAIDWIWSPAAATELMQAEVLVAQYAACVDAGACLPPGTGAGCVGALRESHSTHPINCVDARQADAFCRWVGGRLPGGAPWAAEASNGGTRTFAWGDDAPSCALAAMGGCGLDLPPPACNHQAGNSAAGLCDLSGSLWEWTSDGDGEYRACRGGSWREELPARLGAAAEYTVPASLRSDDIGFRCVR